MNLRTGPSNVSLGVLEHYFSGRSQTYGPHKAHLRAGVLAWVVPSRLPTVLDRRENTAIDVRWLNLGRTTKERSKITLLTQTSLPRV